MAKDRAVLRGPVVAYRRKVDQRRSQRGGRGAQAPYQPSCPRNCIGVKRKEEEREGKGGRRRERKWKESPYMLGLALPLKWVYIIT